MWMSQYDIFQNCKEARKKSIIQSRHTKNHSERERVLCDEGRKKNIKRNIQSILHHTALLGWIGSLHAYCSQSIKEKELPTRDFATTKKKSYEYLHFASTHLYFAYHQHISLLFHITKPSSFFKPSSYTSASKPDPQKENLFTEKIPNSFNFNPR